MRDQLLFGAAPYGAALVCVALGAVQCVRLRRRSHRDDRPALCDGVLGVACRLALCVVAFGHMAVLAVPGYILAWDRRLLRLVLLEGFGVLAGTLAIAGTLAVLVRRLRAGSDDEVQSPVGVVATTLLIVAMTSGVGIAIFYRWASAWSVVTLVPYLQSLIRLEPSPNLVTHMPPLVKLHVLSAFALLAVFPVSAIAGVVIVRVDRLAFWTLAPVSRIVRPAWFAIEAWTSARVQIASARFLRNGEEEN
jgi:nitrate reductase gamma subunit